MAIGGGGGGGRGRIFDNAITNVPITKSLLRQSRSSLPQFAETSFRDRALKGRKSLRAKGQYSSSSSWRRSSIVRNERRPQKTLRRRRRDKLAAWRITRSANEHCTGGGRRGGGRGGRGGAQAAPSQTVGRSDTGQFLLRRRKYGHFITGHTLLPPSFLPHSAHFSSASSSKESKRQQRRPQRGVC